MLEGLLTEGRNPRYLSDMEFDRDRIAPSDDLDGIVREADILILATPSAYLKTFLEPLTVSLKDKFVVSAIKGIVPGDYKTIVEYIHDHYRLSYKQIGIFTGPSHAEEVSRGKDVYKRQEHDARTGIVLQDDDKQRDADHHPCLLYTSRCV